MFIHRIRLRDIRRLQLLEEEIELGCSWPPVLGSDDEKVMRKAIKGAFPDSCSLVRERHLKHNAAT